jgi:hypothetical protein
MFCVSRGREYCCIHSNRGGAIVYKEACLQGYLPVGAPIRLVSFQGKCIHFLHAQVLTIQFGNNVIGIFIYSN